MLAKAEIADQVADFSSRGPTQEMSIKPDILTPGENIYSAAQSLDSAGLDESGPQSGG